MGRSEAEQVEPATRGWWRDWLAANHGTSSGAWVVYAKSRHRRADDPTYEDLIEEALCFGWIDGTLRPVDEARTSLYFSPRRKGSAWAASNKARIERLLADDQVQPAGMAAIERAKEDGSWTVLDRSESLTLPDELADALEAHPGSRTSFDAFPPSARKQLIYWVDSAKRPPTRESRARQVAQQAQLGRRADQPSGPGR